jgi:hypothetical protein
MKTVNLIQKLIKIATVVTSLGIILNQLIKEIRELKHAHEEA